MFMSRPKPMTRKAGVSKGKPRKRGGKIGQKS